MRPLIKSFIPVPFSHVDCPRQNKTMTPAIGSFLQLCWHYRSGRTCWKELNILSSSRLITRTCHISAQPVDKTHGSICGHYSRDRLILRCLKDPDLATSNRTLSLTSFPPMMRTSERRPFSPGLVFGVTRWEVKDQVRQAQQDHLLTTAPLAGCLSLILLSPLFSSGDMLLSLRAIWDSIVPWNYSNSAFGGRVSPRTPRNLLLPAPSVPATRLLIAPWLACYILFLFPTDPGPTSPWTLSQVYCPPRETLSTSWHSPRYHFGSGSPVCLASVEEFLSGAENHRLCFFRLSSTV